MNIACLDFEGVLVPEIWIGLAETAGIDDLKVTTREIADYDELMRYRLDLMDKNGLSLRDVQAAAESLEPLPGAADFLRWLRREFQVAIVSDTFYELAGPLLDKLGYPMMLCHRLQTDANDRIVDYRLRQPDPKRHAVRGFQSMKYKVVAAGDSYNDIGMLDQADFGLFYKAPDKVRADHPEYGFADNYDELKEAFLAARATLDAG